MGRDGFTLVELLVVLGILTALIAILLPVAARARAHAVRLKCAANLRSIGQALTMYVQQYRCYPCCTAGLERSFAIWPVQLRPFLGGNQDVFFCPAQDERCEWEKTTGPGPVWRAGDVEVRFGYDRGEEVLDYTKTFFSYGYNAFGTADLGSGRDDFHHGLGAFSDLPGYEFRGGRHVKANDVKSPSEMIAIADTTADGRSDFMIFPVPDAKYFVWPGSVHHRGANVLFCDGHVQWYLQSELTWDPAARHEPRSMAIQRMWNNNHEPD